MNLYIRLLFVLLGARLKSRISLLEEHCSSHIVWPNDLDPLGHMNNGRYFTITDLVRTEMLIRAGVWQAMRREGQSAVIAGETVQFRRALRPFQRYQIRSRTLGWDEKFFYVEHRFVRAGVLHALALIKVRVIGKGSRRPADVLRYIYPDVPDVRVHPVIDEWNASTEEHWAGSLLAAA